MKIIHRNDSLHTSRTRDAAVRRLQRTNRWLIAGAAVLTGVLTDVAANAFPGHSVHKGASGRARTHAKHKPLAAPSQAPAPATTTQETATQPEASAEAPSAEAQPSAEAAPKSSHEAAPTPAPAEETQAPEVHEAAPQTEEPSQPVVSGGS